VYFDYTSERGYLHLPYEVFRQWFGQPPITNVALCAQPGVSGEELRKRVLARIVAAEGSAAAVTVHDNAALRREVFRVFDQTFRITYALEAIAIVVAIFGVANTLLAVVLERQREFGVLRYIGSTATQTRRLVVAESAWIGLAALVIGCALGAALAAILIFVVNVQSFGWTIQVHVPWSFLAAACGLVFLATLVAAWWPARLAAAVDPRAAVAVD
jgi:putative ABC transport system permease protein